MTTKWHAVHSKHRNSGLVCTCFIGLPHFLQFMSASLGRGQRTNQEQWKCKAATEGGGPRRQGTKYGVPRRRAKRPEPPHFPPVAPASGVRSGGAAASHI